MKLVSGDHITWSEPLGTSQSILKHLIVAEVDNLDHSSHPPPPVLESPCRNIARFERCYIREENLSENSEIMFFYLFFLFVKFYNGIHLCIIWEPLCWNWILIKPNG